MTVHPWPLFAAVILKGLLSFISVIRDSALKRLSESEIHFEASSLSTKYFNLIGKTYELKAQTLFDSKDGVKTDKRQEINRFNDVIKYAREVLNETTINDSYIQTVLDSIDGDKNE